MRKFTLALVMIAVCSLIGIVTAQTFLKDVAVADFKSNGTLLNYFHRVPGVHFINFKTGAAVNTATQTLDVGTNGAVQNLDMGGGTVVSPAGIQIGTLTAKPACTAAYDGTFYTVKGPLNDAGVADATFQCLKSTTGSYSWKTISGG